MTVRCRACGATVEIVLDLGRQPAEDEFPYADDPAVDLTPLRLGVCGACGLVQLADRSPASIDDPDAPSPLTSATMAAHARGFVDDLVVRGHATPTRQILSLASHGGHLAPFLSQRGMSVTTFEQPGARADRLRASGERLLAGHIDRAGQRVEAGAEPFDLIVDNYLLAHLERPRVVLRHLTDMLAPDGTLVVEFDDLLAKVDGGQWDAIGHGHPVYLSLGWLYRELEALGLGIVDATTQPVYGGAVRVFARRDGSPALSVRALLARETAASLGTPAGLAPLAGALLQTRRDLLPHLEGARAARRRVAGYGAPGRAITFLNALEVGPELLPFVVDRAPAKQGRTIPGVRIPILAPEALDAEPPDEVLVLTWNLVPEVRAALAPLVARGTRLLVAIPTLADVTEAP